MKKLILSTIFSLATIALFAQVKIGANPTIITANAKLQVEGSTGNKVTVMDNGNVGIGTTTPSQKLEVIGTTKTDALQVVTGAGAGKVLTSDAAGLATWATPSGGAAGWALTGNTGTAGTAGTNYIGTTDAQDVVFKTSGTERARVLSVPNAAKEIMTVTGGDAKINGVTVGQGLGSGNTNTAVGNGANTGLAANASVYNTAVGFEAFQMSKGNSNTAVGYQALKQVNLTLNNAGSNNTAVGRNAMTGGASGTDNNSGNTAIGSTSLFSITDAEYNTATGYQALYGLTTGDNNVGYGRGAGDALTTGSGNIAIGTSAQVPTATADNQLSIGNTIYGTGINTGGAKIGIGNTAPVYKLDVTGDINASATVKAAGVTLTSDVRLKRNIQAVTKGLATVMQLNPVAYEKKQAIESTNYDKKELGFIAQELQKVLPNLVKEGADKDKILAVDYISLIPVLTKAIQEQQAQIETLKKENAGLKVETAKVAALESQMSALNAKMELFFKATQPLSISGK
jgi:hypothetical protein